MGIELQPGKRAYFISDAHLGAPEPESSLVREKKMVDWIDQIEGDCGILFILGDLLDINRQSGGYSLQLCWTTGFVAAEHLKDVLG